VREKTRVLAVLQYDVFSVCSSFPCHNSYKSTSLLPTPPKNLGDKGRFSYLSYRLFVSDQLVAKF